MNTILQRLRIEFPFVGERPATEQELFDYCERHAVHVRFDSRVEDGVYIHEPDSGIDLIMLNPKLFGFTLLYVFAHEIGHHLLHVPTLGPAVEHFDKYRNNRNHSEAEAVAAYLLLPEAEIFRLLDAGNITNGRLADLIALRLQLPDY